MTNDNEKYTKVENMVLLSEDELMDSEKEAFSAIIKNPAVTWAKFILTDDRPNGNKERVPESEFDNIIKTGVYMPVKMAFSKIEDGHDNSFPLGVITHLQKVGNTIKAIAAFWPRERPKDIEMLKEHMASKKPVNVSWEIMYSDIEEEEGGITSLKDTVLRAVTIVGMPAYKGRTPVLAIAAKGSKAFDNKLRDEDFLYISSEKRLFPFKNENGDIDSSLLSEAVSAIESYTELEEEERKALLEKASNLLLEHEKSIQKKEDDKLETIEELKEKISSIEKELSDLKDANAKKDAALLQKDATIQEKLDLISEADKELTSLKEFKNEVEAANASAEKLEQIKGKFTEAGIVKSSEYFEDETIKEKLLSLEDSALDFMIQEMVAFSESGASLEDKEKGGNKIPKVPGDSAKKPTLQEMAEYLKKNQ